MHVGQDGADQPDDGGIVGDAHDPGPPLDLLIDPLQWQLRHRGRPGLVRPGRYTHDQRGRPLLDDDLLILVNAWWEAVAFSLPDIGRPADWQVELDTYDPQRITAVTAGDPVTVGPRSLTVLRAPR